MEGVSLKSRAIAFALASGAVTFFLAMLATYDPRPDATPLGAALVVAIVCASLTWASAQRCLSGVAAAIDCASARIAEAAGGDLSSPTPPLVHQELPALARALDSMFDQVRGTLDTAQTIAMFDPVTSLANRTHFRLEAERMLAAQDAQAATTLLAFIDLDHFKAVNDTLGHAHGDQLLAKVAKRLQVVAAQATEACGDASPHPSTEALVGRLSGDEFTLLFPAVTSRAQASALGAALLAELTRPFDLSGRHVTIGASIGLAFHPEHGATLPALMRAADVAMYRAKAGGRGHVQVYDRAMASRLTERVKLDEELRRAVANDEFSFVYQPQTRLSDGRVTAAEAMLRWEHPAGELRPLTMFLAPAEDSGLILDIGNWAVERLADRLARWPAHPLAPRLAVTISKRQVVQHGYFERVRGALQARGVPLSLLEFQIDEAVAATCAPAAIDQLRRLRDDGALIVIDEFGAGASNLSRLRTLPIDRVKLSPSLIAAIEHDSVSRDLVAALAAVAHSLGASVAAAGVDTRAQLDLLRVIGCDIVQGRAIAAPMTEADYAAWNAAAKIRA